MKNVVLMILICTCSLSSFSQTENNEKANKYRFGFNLGANYSMLQSKADMADNSEIINGFGFKMGLFMDYSISENFLFSPKTELAFNNSKVETINNDQTVSTYKVFPTTLEIMTHFAYKIGKGKNIPYLLAGPNLRIPLSSKAKSNMEFKNSPDIAIDFGIGLEHVFKYFVFAPEIRYSLGLLDINENPSIENLYYHNISLSINFK